MKNKIHLLVFFLILICGIVLRLYWSTQKEGLHLDDVCTFAITECDGAYFTPGIPIEPHMQGTGKELKRFFFIHDPSFKGAWSDVCSMWHDTYDKPHTNLYYSISRLFFVGMDTTDLPPIILRATLLNLIFFVFSYLIFFKLLLLYWVDRPIQVFVTLFCFSTMAGGIDNTLFFRPYELQMLTVLAMAYWLSRIDFSLADGTWQFNTRNFLITVVLLVMMLMTGYLMLVLSSIWGLFLLWKLYRKGYFMQGAAFFIAAFFCALLLCRVCYQSYFHFIYGDERVTAKLMSDGLVVRLWDNVIVWIKFILSKTLYLPVIALVLPVLVIGHRRIRQVPVLLIPAFLLSLILTILAPYESNQYMVAVTPLLLLVIPMAIDCLKYRISKRIMAIAVVLVYFSMSLFAGNLSNLYKKRSPLELLEDRSGKTHIIQEERWKCFCLLSYLDDNIVYELSDDIHKCDVRQGDLILSDAKMSDDIWNLKFMGEYMCYFFYRVEASSSSETSEVR